MKRLICVVCVLGFIGVSGAERNPEYKNWLTSERLARWQELSKDMTYYNHYTLRWKKCIICHRNPGRNLSDKYY